MKVWKVRSRGILERIIIYLAVGMVIYTFLDVKLPQGYGLITALVFFSIFGIPVILVIFKRLITSKVPIEISLDDDQMLCSIRYSKKSCKVIPYQNLAFSILDKGSYYCVLTFYNSFIGTRGQPVFNEIINIIGIGLTMSWRLSTVLEIAGHLLDVGIEETHAREKELSFLELLISR